MIGRGAYGKPWLLGQAMRWLTHGDRIAEPSIDEQYTLILEHYDAMLDHYGIVTGVQLFRKHLGWYTKGLPSSAEFRNRANAEADPARVKSMLAEFYAPWLQRAAA